MLIAVAAVVVVTVILLNVFVFSRPDEGNADTAFLKQVQIPDWVKVEYIDMYVNARQGEPLEEINGVVVHYVANPSTTAEQNRSYFNNPGTEVVSHFIVGLDGEVVQCLPLFEKSVSSNERNFDTISIEVCHPDESGQFNQTTYDSLVRLTAWLCEVCGFKEDDIIRHYDVTGKNCPKYYVEHEDDWKQFKKDVTEYRKNNDFGLT